MFFIKKIALRGFVDLSLQCYTNISIHYKCVFVLFKVVSLPNLNTRFLKDLLFHAFYHTIISLDNF